MKGCVIALVILALIAGAVAWNAVYIDHVTESLLAELAVLPDEPVPAETPAAVDSIREGLEKQHPLLDITVTHTTLDRITESLRILQAQAVVGDSRGYAATLALLRELVREIGRLEKLSAENIF